MARTNDEAAAEGRKKFTFWQKLGLVWNIITLAFYCFYCIYFIARGLGSIVVNIVLLVTTLVYAVLFVVIWCVKGRKGKRFRGASKRVYKLTRKLTLLANTIVTGGAIINMGAFGNSFLITLLAIIMIVNFVLNIIWLIFLRRMERLYFEKLDSFKAGAKQLAASVKSLFTKGFEKDETAGAADGEESEDVETKSENEMSGNDAYNSDEPL